jgi:hypothetical protein
MTGVSELWTSLREYVVAVAHYWWALAVGGLGGAVGIVSAAVPSFSVPLAVWLTLLIGGLLVAQALAFHGVRMQRDTMSLQVAGRQPPPRLGISSGMTDEFQKTELVPSFKIWEPIQKLAERGIQVPLNAPWNRYLVLLKVTNKTSVEARKARVMITDLYPAPSSFPIPSPLTWWGGDLEERDLQPNGHAYVLLYWRTGLSGNWIHESARDWGQWAIVSVDAWCEGSPVEQAKFHLNGLQGPNVYPAVTEQ